MRDNIEVDIVVVREPYIVDGREAYIVVALLLVAYIVAGIVLHIGGGIEVEINIVGEPWVVAYEQVE